MNFLKTALTTLVCSAVATLSSAGTVHVVFDNPIFATSGYDNVIITFPGKSSGSSTENVLAGRFKGKASNLVDVDPTIFVDGVDNLYMYCYDVYENINSGWAVNYNVNLDGGTARTLDFLGAVNAVMNVGNSKFDQYAWLHPTSSTQSAAIQLGIWESLYETTDTWNIASGAFSATGLESGTNTWLSTFFNSLASSSSIDPVYVMTLEAKGAQDMITGDPPSSVPEPGALTLLGTALLALAYSRRKTQGKKTQA
ncbi:MAG: PEP-CTERM sorting domain-containing protein [Burkholderiaceae bacterium]